jgi:cysteine desulfuration protein SufE
MKTINQIQRRIVEEFKECSDWMDKYTLLIEAGKKLQPLDFYHKTPSNLIKGCQSPVWILCEHTDGKVTYHGDSDNAILKGIVSLLINVLSDQSPDNVISANLYFIKGIGLKEHLSPARYNELIAILKHMRYLAALCL